MSSINKNQTLEAKAKAIVQCYHESCDEERQRDHIPGYFDPYDKPIAYQTYYYYAVRELKQLGISDDEITKSLGLRPTLPHEDKI